MRIEPFQRNLRFLDTREWRPGISARAAREPECGRARLQLLLFVADCLSDQAALSSKRSAVYNCRSSFPTPAVYMSGSWDFRIRNTESIVFQLRVVAGAPKSSSICRSQPIVFMWRRFTPYTRRFFEPMIRTSHSPPSGRAIGRETRRRPASDRMLTN